jgi:hypothetical protein
MCLEAAIADFERARILMSYRGNLEIVSCSFDFSISKASIHQSCPY